MARKRKLKFQPGDFRFKVHRSKTGLGLSTLDLIPKGACILEYKGRTLSKKEEYTSRSKYLFEVHARKTIDGSIKENIARYINHSCRPNSEIEIRKGRVWVMAKRKIKEGEELSYDYDKEYWDEHIKPKGCKCSKCLTKQSI